MTAHTSGIINYDKRQRGCSIESNINKALAQFSDISNWISSLQASELEKQFIIQTEVSVTRKCVSEATTTLARELIFASSHSIHHFSIISVIMQMQNLKIDKSFGIAPATASYLRTETSCAP